jgi:hypothetical protein
MSARNSRSLLLATLLLAAPLVSAAPRHAGPEASADVPTRHAAKGGPSDAEVGDADSFGRNVKWLGVADMNVTLVDDCSGTDPESRCQVLAPGAGVTAFEFEDIGHIALPERASNSLFCHWFSPVLDISYANPTAAPVVARLTYNPSLTVENPVLATPGLIDPTTGLPFGGRLRTSMTASERFEVPLPPGMALSERQRDSAVCIAGFLTRKSLVELYGLSEAQAREFFRRPTTVRLNLSGSAQYVQFASLYFGFRIVGD